MNPFRNATQCSHPCRASKSVQAVDIRDAPSLWGTSIFRRAWHPESQYRIPAIARLRAAEWLLCPIGDENICLVGRGAVAIRSPHEVSAVGGKHRKRIETRIRGDAFVAAAILADEVEIEAA